MPDRSRELLTALEVWLFRFQPPFGELDLLLHFGDSAELAPKSVAKYLPLGV